MDQTNTTPPSPMPPVSPEAAALDAPLTDERPISADGHEIKVGMRVVHFMDEWEHRGPVVLIDAIPWVHGVRFEIHCREQKYRGAIINYSPDLLYVTRDGLVGGKLSEARRMLSFHREQVLVQERTIERLMAELAAMIPAPAGPGPA